MDRDPPERIWPYIVLVVCLLAMAIVAPRYWRWQAEGGAAAPRRVHKLTQPDLVKVEYDSRPALALVELPDAEEAASHVARQEQSLDLLAELPSFDELQLRECEAASGGVLARFGSPVAREYDAGASDEILPPPPTWGKSPDLPEVSSRLDHVDARLAMRLRIAARTRREHAQTVWPRPTALREQLQAAGGDPRCEQWADAVIRQLDALAEVEATDAQSSQHILTKLAELSGQVDSFVLDVRPWQLQLHMVTAAQGLRRRVAIWQQVQELAQHHEPTHLISSVSNDAIRQAIDDALATIKGEDAQRAWSKYLRLDELQAATAGIDAESNSRAVLARAVLERMHSLLLDKRQAKLLDAPAMQRLDGLLRQAATEPVDTVEVIYAIEQYEKTLTQKDAARLAEAAERLRWSTDDGVAELARRIDADYRGMNARTAITAEFLNRLMPRDETKVEEVDETILGSYVAGERTVKTDLAMRLIPDDDAWRLGMEARGTIYSDTASYSGNATLFTQGSGSFAARKLIVVDHHRAHVWPAEANVRYEGELTGASTSLDRLPIISELARGRAVDGYYQNQWAARQEVEARLNRRATTVLDREAHEPLFTAEAQLQRHLLQPLLKAAVHPTTLRLFTTEERITGTWRLAGERQLGGHTARPWAPKGSLFSLQIHESAVNNVLNGLQLDGRQDDVRTLCKDMYTIFGIERAPPPDDLPAEMTLRFADEEAIRVRFEEGRMEVILQIAELRTERRVWKDLIAAQLLRP